MERFALRVLRASDIVYGVGAVYLLLVMAVKGYWTVVFPFLIVVGMWLWSRQRRPSDFR